MKQSNVGVLLVLSSSLCCAVGQARAQDASTQPLPLRDVALFSSGVGYFGHAGKVNGNGSFEMAFRPTQINDILKSLVVFDSGGEVRPIAYGIEDFVARRPLSTDLAINSANTLGGLLRQFQGALVRLETSGGGGGSVEGRIVSVSTRRVTVAGQPATVDVETVTVLTSTGFRVVSLEDVTQARLLDERLDRKLRDSLEKVAARIAAESDDGRRSVQLRFAGRGTREVRAGYLQEMPVWKTSYRLVLGDGAKTKTYLQGWAIVENTTEQDWKDVRLSLISGRPVSFIQNLYQPLYIFRPEVAPQVMGTPLPQVYAETASTAPGNESSGRVSALESRVPASSRLTITPSLQHRSGTASFLNQGQFTAGDEQQRREMAASATALAQSVAAQAEGAERGELFEYAIRQPVTLDRGKAAMVPIVGQDIEGDKLSIFDAGAGVLRAVYGVRLRNTTGLHLSGGPITVFQDGIYAGDAQINNVQPGENRLISYAIDLDLVVGREEPKVAGELLSIVAKSGVLTITRKRRREQVYTFRNKASQDKTVVVQQPIETDWKLVSPAQPSEKSPTEYRFQIAAPAKKTTELRVVSEQPVEETLALLNADFDVIVNYARHAQASPTLRAALEKLVAQRRRISELERQRGVLEGELTTIDTEQKRIRSNMAQLDRDSALYQQYVKKLTEQETRIEKLRQEIARLRDAETVAQKEMREFTDELTI